jgi:hypothetical protein
MVSVEFQYMLGTQEITVVATTTDVDSVYGAIHMTFSFLNEEREELDMTLSDLTKTTRRYLKDRAEELLYEKTFESELAF